MLDTATRPRASEVFDTAETALAICELPRFDSVDAEGLTEVLKYFGDDCTWALVPVEGSDEEYVAVDAAMARDIIMSHFRAWLLAKGYQVQVHCYAGVERWTLVDCLSASEGGGDRLDVDYPCGEDEWTTLIDSIIAASTL